MPGATSAGAGGGTNDVGATAAAGSPEVAALEVSDLVIEANPRMSLGCYVSWTTATAANSEVQFGVNEPEFRIVHPELVTEHRVHVVGMHAESTYTIRAVSSHDTATGSAVGEFTTGSLPETLPAGGVLVAEGFDAMQPGWTLTNVQVGNDGASSNSVVPGLVVIVDEQALPVWYFVHGATADQFGITSTEQLPNGNILVGNASAEPAREVDLEGNVVWEGPTGGDTRLSHHTSKLENGNYLVARESSASARVEEITPNNEVVWSWDLYDHVDSPGSNDWCHLNAAMFDAAEDFLYFNCRFRGVYKAERSTGELHWLLGAAIDASNPSDFTYVPDETVRFNDAHDPELHEDGSILIYDNQGWESHAGGRGTYHSQVVEYQLDEAALTATLTWSFPGDFEVEPWYRDEWATQIWGDADRLDNGNVLVTAGDRGLGTWTRIFEVTRAGVVVWGFEWPENHGSYRADRIPALAERIP